MAHATDSPTDAAPDRVIELAVNLDDTTGEQAGHVIEALLACGALDAWATPIVMKKGRPALMLSALAREADRDDLAERMLELTGSFGVRFRAWDRLVLERSWHDRPTRLGGVRLKAGALHGRALSVKPEFDAVVALAEHSGVSVHEAQRAAQGAADALLDELRRAGGGVG